MSDTVVLEAQRYWEAGELTRAREVLEQGLAEARSYERLCASAVLEHAAGEPHRAKMRLLQAASLAPERPDAYQQLGELFALSDHPERAVGFFRLAAAADPTSPAALNALWTLYQEQGLFYAAKQIARRSLELDPEQPDLRGWLTETDRVLPDREVTLYLPCYNAAAFIGPVLDAVFSQSYPIAEVLVIDDGSSDDTVEIAASYPVRIITHGDNRGLAAARNTALLASKTPYLANLDADVAPDPHWLEHLMLYFESEALNRESGSAPERPLAGVTGRLDELYSVSLPDQWRTVHMDQHHGDTRLDDIPYIYGCNGLYLKAALLQAGGYPDQCRTNGEDCLAADAVRAQGYRLAYDPAARCRHLRRDTLPSVLRTIWRYHTPYFECHGGVFHTGRPADVLLKMQENLTRYQDNWLRDGERRSFHLRYVSFLGLPWRILSDFALAASKATGDDAAALAQTQAAIFLGIFAVLAELEPREDIRRMVHEDLTPCLPADPQLAALCSWDQVEAAARAARGGGAASPMQALAGRDVAVVGQVLETIAAVWSGYSDIDWNQIRSSAYRLRHEQDYRAGLTPGALKVALVNAPWAVDGRIGVRAGSRWPFTQDSHGQRVPCYVPFPFFLATAAAMLKRAGFEVIIVDAIAEGLYAEEFMRRIEGFDPDVILMETATASHEIDLDWCLQYKEALGDDVQVVLCGPHASALDAALMDEAPQVDAIVLGEYEPSFLDLMVALRDGGDLTAIPGLLWRDTDGQVHLQQQRRELPPMSSFPWPERETLPMYNYFDSFANAMPWPNVQMHASRGCPFKCIFCVWPQVVYDGQSYRTRDNADIVDEMTWLVDRYGFKAVYFDDDTFNIDNERIIDLCERIAAAGIDVPICAMGRADTSNHEAYDAMKRAGVVGLKFGVETGDAEMMKRIRKHLDLDKVRRTVGWCKELGIGVHLTFSFGGPGETRETAEKTIRLALELDADTVQFSLMTPFPGTTMYEAALANGTLLTTDWKQYDGARYTVVRGEFLTREELEEVLREAHRRWLMHISERDAVKSLDRPWRPQERRQVTVAGLEELAVGSLESLHLIEPVERIWYEGSSPQVLTEVLARAQARLRPDGLLLLTRSREETCPPAWRDAILLEWAAGAGMEVVSSFGGFNGEVAVVLRRVPRKGLDLAAVAAALAR